MVQPTPGSVVTPLTGRVMQLSGAYRQSGFGSGADWMGPGTPLAPIAPPEVAGRIYDFPISFNTQINPRAGEAISFDDLRNLADSYDIIRLIIETRKDQMERRKWEIRPKTSANGDVLADENDPRITDMSKFFERPDGVHSWNEWSRQLLEEMFVLDAPALYRRRTRGGKLFGLEVIDGSRIKRIIDPWGRTPLPPLPAYQHILKGMPAVDYTSQDLLYTPRNVRAHKPYGFSPVEQVIMSVNIAMRRQLFQLQYYTEGNIPEALVGAPDQWTPEQIGKFQVAFDAMLAGNQAMRRRIKFVPGGVAKTFIATKEPDLTGKQDEWLARIACFAFSISPQPFVSMMNRATAQTAHDASIEEGLAPIEAWLSYVCNRIMQEDFGIDDLEFGWQDDREADAKEQSEVLSKYVEDGILVIDEAREVLGQAPLPDGAGAVPRVKTATGFINISINDDAPTAGEAHQQRQDQAAAQADALAAGGGPQKPGGNKPPAKSAEDAKKALVPFDLLKRRRPVPMTHRTKAVTQGERRLSVLLRRVLKDMARSAADAALTSLHAQSSHVKTVGDELAKASTPGSRAGKAASDALDYSLAVVTTERELERVAQDGARRALISIGVQDDEAIVNLTYDEAAAWAAERAAEMVGMRWVNGKLVENPKAEFAITDTARDDVRALVESSINEGLPASELADKIEALGVFSEDRAIMIARTEIIRANNEGHMAAFRASGVVEQKEWSTAEDADCCDDCQANADQGPIGLEDEFESGDVAPPLHPNCRCTLVPYIDETATGDEE